MEEVDPRVWTFLIGFGAFVLVVIYLIVSQAIRRRKGLMAIAAESGYDYRRDDSSVLEPLEGFSVLPVGSNRRCTNVLKGEFGSATLWLFDYSYHTGGKHSSYSCRTVCAIRSPDVMLPYFDLRCAVPGLDRLGSALVQKGILPPRLLGRSSPVREISFPEDDAFSKKFVLTGREDVVRPIFDWDLRQYLMRFAGTMTRLEGDQDTLLVAAPEPVLPKNARALIQQATEVFALLAQRSAGASGQHTGHSSR
jgi:hypothetical protein